MRTSTMQRTVLATVTALAASTAAVADSWGPGPSLNHARGFAASVLDPCGDILVIGGMERVPGGQVILSSIERLSFDGSSYASNWAPAGFALPIERFFHTAVTTNGFLYVIGGARWGADPNFVEPTLQVDRYDFFSQTWDSTSVPPIPYPNIGHASVVDQVGRIWMIGGQVPNDYQGVRDSTVVFDPGRPQLGWQSMPSLNTKRTFPDNVVDQIGRIWTIGGLDDGYQNHINTVEIFDPCTASNWASQSSLLPPPVTNSVQACIGADGLIYTSGGWASNNYISTVCRINPRNPAAAWASWTPLNLPRNEHTMILGRDDRIYVIGGEAGGVQSQTSVESLYTGRCPGDLNNDRTVDLLDLTLLLSTFGAICP